MTEGATREDKPRVLVVDDERGFLELFSNRFSRRGLEVWTADSGAKGLEELAARPMDVVVLDLKMPGMDGIETLVEIKKRHPLVEVILLTGHGSVESGLQGMGHGAYDYVMKPYKFEDLLSRITKALEHRKLKVAEAREGKGR